MSFDKENGCILILARAGSKGIKNKNMIDVCGKPLIYYVLDSAIKYAKLDVFVSSDSKKILDYAAKLNVNIVKRPASISGDHSLDLEGFEHFFLNNTAYDYAVHLRATCPLVTPEIIGEAHDFFIDNYKNFDSLRSMSPVKENPYKMWHIDSESNIAKTVIPGNLLHSSPRQIIEKSFVQNACIDVVKRKTVLKYSSMIGKKCLPFLMKNKNYIDIDHLSDLEETINVIRIRNGK